jgi:hypothetical protein
LTTLLPRSGHIFNEMGFPAPMDHAAGERIHQVPAVGEISSNLDWQAKPLQTKPFLRDKVNNVVDNPEASVLGSIWKRRSMAWKSQRHLWAQLLIHLPSIATTISVVSLTFRNVFWARPVPEMNSVLNALQFAARVHESLIILSLSAIVLSRLHLELVGQRGVSIGLLCSGYQLSSLTYIFSWELWGGMFGRPSRRLQQLPLIFLVLVALILALLSSPSSAITMIPKLDWWPYTRLAPRNSVRFEVYMKNPEGSLFPETLRASDLPSSCFTDVADRNSICPSAGLPRLMAEPVFTTTIALPFTGYSSSATNLTMSIRGSGVARYLSGAVTPLKRGRFATTTVPDFVASVLAWYWTKLQAAQYTERGYTSELQKAAPRLMIKANLAPTSSALHKPLVRALCIGFPPESPTIEFPEIEGNQPIDDRTEFSKTILSIPRAKISNITSADGSGRGNFTWTDLEGASVVNKSLGAIFVQPLVNKDNPNSIYACTLDAKWLPVDAWIDPSVDSVVHEPHAADVKAAIDGDEAGGSLLPSIHVEPGWGNSLNVLYNTGDSNVTAMEAIGTYCSKATMSTPPEVLSADRLMPRCLTTALGLYLADGLSRLRNPLPLYLVRIEHEGSQTKNVIPLAPGQDINHFITKGQNATYEELQDETKYLRIYLPVYRYGYGYGFRGIAIYIAVGTLLIHVLLCFIHLVSVVRSGTSNEAGPTMSEMLLLAINSPPMERSRSVATGVGKMETWRELVRFRNTSEGQIGLVIAHEQGNGTDIEMGMKPRHRKSSG